MNMYIALSNNPFLQGRNKRNTKGAISDGNLQVTEVDQCQIVRNDWTNTV